MFLRALSVQRTRTWGLRLELKQAREVVWEAGSKETFKPSLPSAAPPPDKSRTSNLREVPKRPANVSVMKFRLKRDNTDNVPRSKRLIRHANGNVSWTGGSARSAGGPRAGSGSRPFAKTAKKKLCMRCSSGAHALSLVAIA